ncbi:radical SAM enzyme [Lojkania enalia]|uniref:Radical SAM enzyme n=1 Tax=Lojkania enalia TaxID=147567 RepID=A0A9P4N7K9_9PLEO|nr:radical SAM enzyme [Didymosphaeria enalia]
MTIGQTSAYFTILGHTIPVSVNYHFTRKCNAECGFCFHTETTSYVAKLEDAQRALKLLKESGMRKLNFAGGEPFLYHRPLGKMCQYAKEELKLESVSIVSNGTKVTENWLKEWGKYIDILAISCDSFHEQTNRKIGRADRGTKEPFDNVAQLFQIRDWCHEFDIKFKLNTVVCSLNWEEDMVDVVKSLNPFRWKVFQVLVVEGENDNEKRMRDAGKMVITDEQFKTFCEKHKDVKGFTPEPNSLMRNSYLILDEHLRFLSPENKSKASKPILEVGVQNALNEVDYDEMAFKARGGEYDWGREANIDGKKGCGGGLEGIDLSELEF